MSGLPCIAIAGGQIRYLELLRPSSALLLSGLHHAPMIRSPLAAAAAAHHFLSISAAAQK
jgi:hypothetical protein